MSTNFLTKPVSEDISQFDFIKTYKCLTDTGSKKRQQQLVNIQHDGITNHGRINETANELKLK